MDNELQELEAELKRLRPRTPSRGMTEDIARQLATVARRNLWAWTALPLAAMVAGLILLRDETTAPVAVAVPVAVSSPKVATTPTAPPSTAIAAYKPVSAVNVLYDQSDEGLVTLADGTQARRTRSSYVDTITWRNPRTQASLKWTVPRTEERVVPVSFQ